MLAMNTTDCIYNHYLIGFLIYGAVSVSKYIILHINIHCTILLNSKILNSNCTYTCTKIIQHRLHLFLYMQILNYMYTKLLFLWVPNVRLFSPTWFFIRKLDILKKQLSHSTCIWSIYHTLDPIFQSWWFLS